MEYTAQFTYDCLWRVDGEKRVCTGGHESDGYPCIDDIDLRGMKIWSRYEEFGWLRSVDR